MGKPRLRIDLITLFPKLAEGPLNESMIKQAKNRGSVEIRIHSLRDYALDKRASCDDKPFGGGAGMVMMVQPIFDCLKTIGRGGWRERLRCTMACENRELHVKLPHATRLRATHQ